MNHPLFKNENSPVTNRKKQQIKTLLRLAELYSNRIKKYITFEIITLPELKNAANMPVKGQKLKEGERILDSLNNDDLVILLDERGKEMRTVEFSESLEKHFMLPKKRIIFYNRRTLGIL